MLGRGQGMSGVSYGRPNNMAARILECSLYTLSLAKWYRADRDLALKYTYVFRGPGRASNGTKKEIYDRPGVRLRMKVRLLQAEVVETLL